VLEKFHFNDKVASCGFNAGPSSDYFICRAVREKCQISLIRLEKKDIVTGMGLHTTHGVAHRVM
jgi:hypothetical protein